MLSRTPRAGSATLAVAAAVVVGVFAAAAAPAAAHVTVNPRDAEQGGYTRVAFRVPTESDTLNTTALEVHLPEDNPIASVSTMPVPGWTVAVEKGAPAKPVQAHGTTLTEVVKKITWTAAPEAVIKPGQFQEFPVSLGPLPAADRMVFKALQTYSDGSVVRWIEEPTAGGEEPEKPAPVLKLAPKGAAAGGQALVAAPGRNGSTGDESGPALGLAIAGLVAGLGGLALGALAFLRTRRRAEPPAA